MDYFKVLNLVREPFSNSPEPAFFFQAPQYISCLQKLELSIRLRRGLNVVIGSVGTGKTTLCRQLILKLSESNEDRQHFEIYLVMDPSFTNTLEFLSTVALNIGINDPASLHSEWQLKEQIKNYLFKKGVEEGKTIVLIIDEGQKLPDYCLEVLREFLNYETNEYKLLQIVIFAQEEFVELIEKKPNFADRINEYYYLQHLNFRDTRQMVLYRLKMASDGETKPPALFTFAGLWAVYRATKGYPRKVITLCHKIMLALIIQNKTTADFFLTRSCAKRISFNRSRYIMKWVTACVCLALALIFSATFFDFSVFNTIPEPLSVPLTKPAQSPATFEMAEAKVSVLNTDILTKDTVKNSNMQSNKNISTNSDNKLKSVKKTIHQSDSSTDEQASSSARKENIKVYGNIDNKRYHLPGMLYYDEVEAYHRVEFSSEEEAIKAGYHKAPR